MRFVEARSAIMCYCATNRPKGIAPTQGNACGSGARRGGFAHAPPPLATSLTLAARGQSTRRTVHRRPVGVRSVYGGAAGADGEVPSASEGGTVRGRATKRTLVTRSSSISSTITS